MEASFMFLSTTVTLCLLFVPKIYAIVTSGGNPIIACTGILVDNSNTRRFVFDDRKEIYYRAEVQNRVYKRELVELDQKIERLERLLELPIQNHTRLTDELLYLLPESKVDGTPRCHRRYKTELERCHSISDGGEGVIYDATENDDILMEMGFTADFRPTPPAKKRHHSGDLSRVGTKTLQKLTRSLSIGGGGRARRKRKCRDPSKALTPFSASEINVMKCGDSGDGPGIGKLRTGKQKSGRYSEDLSYLYSDTLLNIPVNCGHSSSSVPMLDKVTQTNGGASLQELEGVSVDFGSRLSSAKRDEVAGHANDACYELLPEARDRERGKERSGPEEDSHGSGKPGCHLHLINSKQGQLFAVQRLHIELVEEDSNSTSNNEDAESLAGSANGSGDVNNITSDVSGDLCAHQRKSTTRPLHRTAAVCNSEPVTWYERNHRLSSSPCHKRSSPHTYLQPYEEFDVMQGRSRSISTPDQPKATRSEQTVAPSPETPTGLLPTTTSFPLHYSNPSCLCKEFVHFIQAETRAQPPPDDYLRYNLLTTSPRRSPVSVRVAQSKLQEDNPKKSNGTELCTLSGLLSSTKSLCSNVSLVSSQSPEHGCLLIHKSGCPLAGNTLQTAQNQSLEWEPHFSSLIESNSVDSQEIDTDAARVMSSTLHTPIRMSGVEVQRSVLESERRQRIHKLQTDLKKIQMELKDLTDIDCDTSEV
ncbi:unnamed protein product [Lymnaea stagnalis]|uniref:Uncharacterized protein n=1 Tax=Lymnaea stagnalis TaxID=6523 RepID=A0AAV2HY49_LYMST